MFLEKNKFNLIEKLEWGKYVSPLSDKNSAPFNWYGFKHRFGSELVSNVFSLCKLSEGDTVFDPFCGGGTTLIKAKLDGYNSVGLDISPFSVFLTRVLTSSCDSRRLKKALHGILQDVNSNPNIAIPDVAILNKSFSDSTLKYIFSLRDAINSLSSHEHDFLLFTLLSILNDVSKAKKSGGFLRITSQRKVAINAVKGYFIRAIEKLTNDLTSINYSNAYTKVILGDARKYPAELKNKHYDAILTSPPYPNRHDYTRIYELELLVGFINDNQSLKCLRYETLRSHVEAKKKYEAINYTRPPMLEDVVRKLKRHKLNNSQIISTLTGYFEDMYLCLKEMKNVLKENKYIALIVSNVRFAGVMIPVDELLAEIGEQIGLKTEAIYILRYRGNSSQQMLRHKKEPARESLLVWKK